MCDLLKHPLTSTNSSLSTGLRIARFTYNDNGFKTISPPFSGCFSTFPHGTLYAIGLNEYLVFGVFAPGFCTRIQTHATLDVYKKELILSSSLSLSRVFIPKHT